MIFLCISLEYYHIEIYKIIKYNILYCNRLNYIKNIRIMITINK